MRIIVCTKRDLAGALVLNQLLPNLSGCEVLVLLSDKTRPVEKAVPELAEMKFFERDLPIDTLFPLIDRMGQDTAPLATFEGVPARFGVPVKVIDDINGPATEALIRDFAPDLMLSARFSLIFKRHIFEIPRFGTYNVHPGALPRYAGLFAPFRCLVEGGERIGCTLHRVDDGIDTGPVVGIGWLPVDRGHSLMWHVVNTYRPGIDLFLAMLTDIRAGRPVSLAVQDRSQRVYGSLPDAEAFTAFHAKGYRLFDPAEFNQIVAGFLPRDLALADQESGVEAACCCAHA
ncbi:MAG: formyl transferase [Solirubrobacterales bacterium]